MIVKYTINVPVQAEAIKMAHAMARSHGFKIATVIQIQQTAQTEWIVTLNVTK